MKKLIDTVSFWLVIAGAAACIVGVINNDTYWAGIGLVVYLLSLIVNILIGERV